MAVPHLGVRPRRHHPHRVQHVRAVGHGQLPRADARAGPVRRDLPAQRPRRLGRCTCCCPARRPSPRSPAGDYGMWWTGAVGASGAVFGLFGAFLVLQRRLGRSAAGMYVIIGINAVIGFVIPGIAWQAHLGGLLTGAAVAAAIAYTGRNRGPLEPAPTPRVHWVSMGGILVVLVVLTIGEVRPGRPERRGLWITRVSFVPSGDNPCGQPRACGRVGVSASGWSSGSRRASGRSRRRGSSGRGPAPGTGSRRRCSR